MATTRRRPKHDPKDSEREILDAAEQLLREVPFREVTVDAVMRRTGLKRPAFYVHFRDRHDLVLRVVADIGAQLLDITQRWFEGDDPVVDGRATFEGLVAVYVEHGPVLRSLSEAAGTDETVEAAYRGLVQGFIDATVQHIQAEQAAGRIGDIADVAETARALIWLDERYLAEALGRTPTADPGAVVDVLHRIWIATLYGSTDSRT